MESFHPTGIQLEILRHTAAPNEPNTPPQPTKNLSSLKLGLAANDERRVLCPSATTPCHLGSNQQTFFSCDLNLAVGAVPNEACQSFESFNKRQEAFCDLDFAIEEEIWAHGPSLAVSLDRTTDEELGIKFYKSIRSGFCFKYVVNQRGYSQTGVFNRTPVFSSNRGCIGPHHKSIKYSTNESTVLLKNPGF